MAEALWRAGRVDIYATGGAGIAARELHFKCMQLGLNANAFLDSQMQVMSAAALTPRDVGIAISHTRHAGPRGRGAEAGRLGRGQDNCADELSRHTRGQSSRDRALYDFAGGAMTYDSPTVRTAQLAVVDVIYEVMLMQGEPPVQENMARVARAMSKYTGRAGPQWLEASRSAHGLPHAHATGRSLCQGRQHGHQVQSLRPQIRQGYRDPVRADRARRARDARFERLVQETHDLLQEIDAPLLDLVRGQAEALEFEFDTLLRYGLVTYLRDDLTIRNLRAACAPVPRSRGGIRERGLHHLGRMRSGLPHGAHPRGYGPS